MQKALLVKGRLTGPTSVELDEAVVGMTQEVEVLLRPAVRVDRLESVSDYLRNLPAGTRSKAEIDKQIRAERADWGDR